MVYDGGSNNMMNREDRDLLIELKTEMTAVKDSIKALTDTTRTKVDDHELRLRFIERYVWLAMGALAITTFGLNLLK